MPRHKCRHSFCPNYYDDVIGAPGSWGKTAKAECVPCFYAGSFIQNGQTPEQIEQHESFMKEMLAHLEKVGWSWPAVKDSFERMKAVGYDAGEF